MPETSGRDQGSLISNDCEERKSAEHPPGGRHRLGRSSRDVRV